MGGANKSPGGYWANGPSPYRLNVAVLDSAVLPACTGLGCPLLRADLCPLLLGLRRPPAMATAGDSDAEGGAFPKRVNRASISSFCREFNTWSSTMCLTGERKDGGLESLFGEQV